MDMASHSAGEQSLLSSPPAHPDPPLADPHQVSWPAKCELFGVEVTPTDYQEASACILTAAKNAQSAVVSCHAVHALVTTANDAELRTAANQFDMITPDGQPVRWALNALHGCGLQDRVYGPQLTLDVCEAAAEQGVPVYFYGGSEEAVGKMARNLRGKFPRLSIAGCESPPFRELTEAEEDAMVDRVNGSGAGIVMIGLGFPKQDIFAARFRDRLNVVLMCVGAAFDFHAQLKSQAPSWMQAAGLEWLYRLCQEPRRLWKRYLVTNTHFLWKFAGALLRRKKATPKPNAQHGCEECK
ncbi:MAG TPA: glycosyltransferase [Planctomycetaceae bacterium]|nr:glycosyl transferase [Blastopirellula sp.]HAY78679.1 glycosyltransferase [Planctomycetaceae bacterium]|tara:strand:- start:102 stop:995 length:894 start_codon:yes stop_codon:yes gene_type:complete